MNAFVDVSIESVMEQTGERREARRRLSDKILAAFNHAYSVGELEIASQLKAVLVENESRHERARELRNGHDPLGEAQRWVDFIDARNRYRMACGDSADSAAAGEALDTMKEAYRLWHGG